MLMLEPAGPTTLPNLSGGRRDTRAPSINSGKVDDAAVASAGSGAAAPSPDIVCAWPEVFTDVLSGYRRRLEFY